MPNCLQRAFQMSTISFSYANLRSFCVVGDDNLPRLFLYAQNGNDTEKKAAESMLINQ